MGGGQGDVGGGDEPGPAGAGRRPDLAGALDLLRLAEEIVHVGGRGQVRDRQADRVQVVGDLPVGQHESHVAARVLEAVGAELYDVRPVPGLRDRVDERPLELDLLLDLGAEQEDPVKLAQHLGRRRVVQRRDDVPRGPRQVGRLGLHPHHRGRVGARVGERLHQPVPHPSGRPGHQNHVGASSAHRTRYYAPT
jgi:hypothetical protein